MRPLSRWARDVGQLVYYGDLQAGRNQWAGVTMRSQVVELARNDVLDAVGFTLSLLVAVGFIVLVWWLGKVTKLWWLLGVLRERWQSGLPGAGPCEWPGCPDDALRYGRYCAEHEHQNRVRYEESRRWS